MGDQVRQPSSPFFFYPFCVSDDAADQATREKVLHSYELMARYVFPHFQGTLAGIESTARWASERREVMQGGRLAGLERADETYYNGKR